jgi:hypothetical protein
MAALLGDADMGDAQLATSTSPAKIEANRQNARLSTGPRTPEGKAVSALNATRHGLFTVCPVVAGLESAEAWDAHRSAIASALRPVDALEELLADRVALAAWRLGRVARYEREAVLLLQEKAGEEMERARVFEIPGLGGEEESPVHAAEVLRKREQRYNMFNSLPGMADAAQLDPTWAMEVLGAAAEEVGAEDYPLPPGCPEDDPETWSKWTAGNVRSCLANLAKQAGEDLAEVLHRVVVGAAEETSQAQAKLERATVELERLKRKRILPEAGTIEKIMRYEGYLERGLYRALHELWRLQASRAGGHVPAPAVLDVDVAVGPSEGTRRE